MSKLSVLILGCFLVGVFLGVLALSASADPWSL